jgi:large subunit ribosomal protein L9
MLTKDVKDLGQAGEVKEVADGFGRNFLIPRKLAVLARKGVEEEAKRIRVATAKREAKEVDEARALAEEIGNKTVVVRLKVGDEGKAFGSITSSAIAEALKAQHQVAIDRHWIELREPIKTLGEHQVKLRLHRDVEATINLVVTQDR